MYWLVTFSVQLHLQTVPIADAYTICPVNANKKHTHKHIGIIFVDFNKY